MLRANIPEMPRKIFYLQEINVFLAEKYSIERKNYLFIFSPPPLELYIYYLSRLVSSDLSYKAYLCGLSATLNFFSKHRITSLKVNTHNKALPSECLKKQQIRNNNYHSSNLGKTFFL